MSEIKSFEIFAPLVSSFQLSEPPDTTGYEPVEVSGHTWLEPLSGTMRTVPVIWFRPEEKLTPKALQAKVQKWLLRLEIAVDNEIAGIVTSILALLSEDGHSLSQSLQLLGQHVFEVEVMHWHVLPTLAGNGWQGSLKWEGFEFGRLDSQKLVYRCQKAQAKMHEQSASRLNDKPALMSPVFKRKIIDVGRLFWTLKSPAVRKHGVSVLEPFLQLTATIHAGAMWEALEDAFLLPIALSAPIFNVSTLRSATGAETWTCYFGIGLNGTQTWITRDIQVRSERFPSDWSQVQRMLDGVNERYHLGDLAESKLIQLVNQMARTIARSNNHLTAARQDESFLFLIIALEQVFSEKENTTKAVSGRTALVTHRALGKSYPETVKLVTSLYDRRSRLVHQGEVGVSMDDMLTASDLAVETLRCLIRLSALPESKSEEAHKKWLKKLDYLIAGFDAERPPSDAELIETGILEAANP